MDLTELLNKTLELLNVKNANEITEKLFDVVKDNRNDIYEKFSELVSNDLSILFGRQKRKKAGLYTSFIGKINRNACRRK